MITLSDGTYDASLPVPAMPPPTGWAQWLEVRDTGVGMTSDVDPRALHDGRRVIRPRKRLYDWDRNSFRGLLHDPATIGVGVLASFLLGNEIQVITRHISAAEHEGICFQLAEYADEAELNYCRAPIGTIVRVKLDAATADKLVSNPDAWDWFQYTKPPVTRAHVKAGNVSFFLSTLPPLDRNEPSDSWRSLSRPRLRRRLLGPIRTALQEPYIR